MILSPRWTSPAVCAPRGRLAVVVSRAARGLSARLDDGGRRRVLGPPESARRPGGRGPWHVAFAMPPDLPPGLYSLALVRRGRVVAREPGAVWLPRPGAGRFAFVHLSDFHVVQPGCVRPVLRDAALRRLVRHVRETVKPDFILDTGDLVTRYGQGKRPLPQSLIRRQIQAARRALLRLRVPYFMTPGNHDAAFAGVRRLWHTLMGGHWTGGRHDYGFTYRGVRFLALDRSVRYSRRNVATSFRVTAAQKRRLASELAAAAAARRPVVLFCHYDYTGELAPLLRNPPVIKVFYGHKNRSWLPSGLEKLDGLLNSKLAYQRVVVAADGRVRCRPGLPKAVFLKRLLRNPQGGGEGTRRPNGGGRGWPRLLGGRGAALPAGEALGEPFV